MTLREAQHIHVIGIGGIGVSAIAKWLLEQNKQITGSDVHENPNTTWLAAHGVTVHIGPHMAEHIPERCELVIHTVAVQTDNPELSSAHQRGIPTLDYPQALNELLASKEGIAIAGSHGKSTTTALLGYILVEAQLDPTVIVGTRVRLFGNTNERIGKGPNILIEADEYNQGILIYYPKHAAVLNVDYEHVDVYPKLAALQKAFQTFVRHVPVDGTVTLPVDDPTTPMLRAATSARVQTFGLSQGDIFLSNVQRTVHGQSFETQGLYQGAFSTQLYGTHNLQNILAALAVAKGLGISLEDCQKAVAAFPGTWRRFENRGTWRQATIIDDYAHHPTEIQATLQATRQAFPGRRIVCIFQPHLRSRTAAFLQEFTAVLQQTDICVVLEVYDPVGRASSEKISSKSIVQAISSNAHYAKDVSEAVAVAAAYVQAGDVVLTLGAGDITDFAARAQTENPKV